MSNGKHVTNGIDKVGIVNILIHRFIKIHWVKTTELFHNRESRKTKQKNLISSYHPMRPLASALYHWTHDNSRSRD
jgi:hypothetical protein